MEKLNNSQSINEIIQQQRLFFGSNRTKDIAFRIEQLTRLKQAILAAKPQIFNALKADLGKPEFEAYVFEIGVIKEVDFALKHIKSWVKPKKVSVSVDQFPASARIYPEPLGVVLIISPWNYPFQLAISPLVGAIAAGNCAVIKPSEIALESSRAIAEIIQNTFEPSYIAVVEGGVETSQKLLEEKFDYIFFTGGAQIGKIVMAAAAKHLTPITLELGGKSPCIVDADMEIDTAARRIVWGKFVNAGQTCIAPDYLLVDKAIKAELLKAIKACIGEFYGEDPATSPDFARIISFKHYQRLTTLLEAGDILVGGQVNPQERFIAPTVIDNVSLEDPIMQEEIFGPILPVIEYGDLSEAIAIVRENPKPLALYFFSKNKDKQARILQETSSGGVCINHTVLQVSLQTLPFGGVGESGIGGYHGKASFDTFSHHKSVLSKPFRFDMKLLYPPYKGKISILKKIIG